MDNHKNCYTKHEIEGQPELWIETLKSLQSNIHIQKFLKPLISKKHLNVILTGAGSSAYIGESVEHLFRFNNHTATKAISTTTLVTHFKTYIDTSVPLLLISFARSGNSPESIAAIDIAETHCEEVYHVAITCNKSGELAKQIQNMSNGLAIILPPATEDKGLAMTGSFTSMILAATLLSDFNTLNGHKPVIDQIVKQAKNVIKSCSASLKEITHEYFDRIVFLGSGPLQGIAKESHLKVQELSDGQIIGKFDSFLGFRHGPKAVVNQNTILVFLFSTEEEVFRYENDLVKQIINDGIAKRCIGVFCKKELADGLDLDQKIIFDLDETAQSSAYNTMLYVLPAQIIGLLKSVNLGLNPDTPSENGVISRVVKGVTIYN